MPRGKKEAPGNGVRCANRYFVVHGDVNAPLAFISDDISDCLAYLRRNLSGRGRLYRTKDQVLLAFQRIPTKPAAPDPDYK
jgi:hypothetical protein